MATLSFDTLKLARRLESAGFSSKQAGDTAEALAESFRETSGLATKQDLVELGGRWLKPTSPNCARRRRQGSAENGD